MSLAKHLALQQQAIVELVDWLELERRALAQAKVDGEKLQVVLDNLLSNAIDFSPDGGLIQLHATLAGNTLTIACIDQGPGIAAEDAQRIFEPFVQGGRAPPTPRQGSGVGLSIVRELMGAMGGRVQLVANAQQGGANFTIELPCDEQH